MFGVGFGYGWLLRVQSVTWAAVVGCPCDWWWLVLSCFTLVTLPPLWIADQVRNDGTMRCIVFTLCSQCQALGQALVLSHQGRGGIWLVVLACSPSSPCHPVVSRLRGNDGEGRGNDGVVGLSCSPSPLIPLPSRERGDWLVVLACCCPAAPLDCGSSPQ